MFEFFKKIRGIDRKQDRHEDWPSIVLLLREPILPNADAAIEMARAAWGAAGPVELVGTVGPHNFVIRIAPLTFAMHASSHPYGCSPGQLSAFQQECWDQHSAWLSVDLPGKKADILRHGRQLASAYRALMFFVNKHWSPNCSALYFPSEPATLPNYGDLIESIRSARCDGINLDFLKEPKPQ